MSPMSGVDAITLAHGPSVGLILLLFLAPSLLAVAGLILAFLRCSWVAFAMIICSCVAATWWVLLNEDFWWLGLSPFILGAIAAAVAYVQRRKMK